MRHVYAQDTCVVQTDKFTGKSRGFGFISFFDTSIHAGLERRSDLELDGRAIHVRPAVPESEVNKKVRSHPLKCNTCMASLNISLYPVVLVLFHEKRLQRVCFLR